MIYNGYDVLMDFRFGRELKSILDGGLCRLDEDELKRHMTMTYDTLVKDLYIHLSYDIITDSGVERHEVLTKHFSEIQTYALKARETMANLYKREFSNRTYRQYIHTHFRGLDDPFNDLII